jgi:hypothetical protein
LISSKAKTPSQATRAGCRRPALLLAAMMIASVLANAEPIRLHPANSHYFLFNGRAVVLVTSGEHYGAVINADFDYPRYLATLQADGMNYTRLFGGSYVEAPAKSFGILRNDLAPTPSHFLAPWSRSGSDGYAGGGAKFDLTRWNQRYFERLRGFLSDAAKRGIVVELTFFSSQYDEKQWNLSPFNSANNVNHTGFIDWKKVNTLDNGAILSYQERYTRRLVREVNSFDNVIFEIANEPWSDRPVRTAVVNPYLSVPARDKFPHSVDVADEPSLMWQSRVSSWITGEEAALPKKHLIAQNYSNFGFPVKTLAPNVSIINFHYAFPEAVLFNYGLNKVISYDESGFLGRDDAVYRRQAWNFLLSGGGAFDGLDYSFSVGNEDGSDTAPNGPGGGSPAFRRQLRILSGFLQTLSLPELSPDSKTVLHASAPAHVLSNPAKEYALYLDGRGVIDVTLQLPSGQYSVDWMNPATGQVKHTIVRSFNAPIKLQSPPADDGIALHLAKQKEND